MDLLQKIGRVALLLCLLAPPSLHARDKRISVGGFGWLGSIELRDALQLLEFEDQPLDGRKVDDGAFLMLTRLKQSGYLDARISGTYIIENGEERSVEWDTDFEPMIDPDAQVKSVHYEIHPGVLYYYEEVEIDGLQSIEEENAKGYFFPDDALISRKKDRSYSPSLFSGQQKQLTAALAARGRTDARVVDESVELDPETGAVTARLTVDEGPLYRVVDKVISISEDGEQAAEVSAEADAIYTRAWVDEQIRALRNESYSLGYPDTRINSRISDSKTAPGEVLVTMRFDVERGNKVYLSDVEHRGATDTHLPLLERKAKLAIGKPLDISEVEAARRRLSRLGIFRRIDLEYESDGENERQAIFNYENGDRLEWQLLLGYGSYESVRAGVIGRRSNLFGRAHSMSFEAIQSVKSTHGKLDYTMPELLGESIDMRLEANFLDREELFFDRTERGVSVGLSTYLPKVNTNVGLTYAFDRKSSSDPQLGTELGLTDANIGSISLRASRSTVDNILYPAAGYEISTSLRYADEALGGETEFIRPELGASWHKRLNNRWLVHLAGKGGYLSSPNDNFSTIPINERFVIGGENSLRGFRRGEAIPAGAEAYVLFNAEVEYPLFDRLNAVLFFDVARVWPTTGFVDRYEDLADVGIGLRYKTIIGPVRLEYGHNIDPRTDDPEGTVHLSIGFPF